MTPTTVRMVLVEGEKADGLTVDHDTFDVTTGEGSATSSSAAEQVVSAVLGTQESAVAGGHALKSIGVTWSDHTEASALRDALASHGIDDVLLVSEGHAAAALAQAVGRAVGYDTTALLFIDRDTATLSVVQTDDGSVVKVDSRTLHSGDAMAVLAEMAGAVDTQDSPPQGMFVVGSGVDVSSVKAHLEHLVSVPVSAPEEPELALARGAALASAHAPAMEASTVGLAYSQDPDDGTTAGGAYAAMVDTQLAAAASDLGDYRDQRPAEEGRKPFLLVGSALTSIFVVGVVALVISLAVSIRPTVDQRPSPGPNAIIPSAKAPAPPALPEAQPAPPPAAPPPAPAAPPAPETIKAPVPVVQEAPQVAPRTVYVEQPKAPAPQAPAPAPAAPAPAPPPPAAPAPVPVPVPVAPAPRPPSLFNPYYPPRLPVYRPPVDIDPPKQWRPSWKPPWEEPERDEPEAPNWPSPQYPQYPRQTESREAPQVPDVSEWLPGRGDSGSGRSGGSGDYGSGGRGGSGGSDSGGGRGGDSPLWPLPWGN